MKDETKCIHPLRDMSEKASSVTTGVNTSTAYHYLDQGELIYPGFSSTINQQRLGSIIANLEGGEFGIAFNSGMSAITSAILALIKTGDHVIFGNELYGGTMKLASEQLAQRNISCSFASNSIDHFESSRQENTRLVFIESPSNPLLNITDLHGLARWAKKHNIITIIDNTFATPINQRPLSLGFDISVHSGTKYLGGHNDLMFGAVATKLKKYYQSILDYSKLYGGSLDANSCYLAERSIKTLSLRVHHQNASALTIARYLEEHPMISNVYYPGLPSHKHHAIARAQMKGYGGMVSFELNIAPAQLVKFLSKLTIISPALSLGGVESLMCIPALTSHAGMSPDQRKAIGISDTLVRMSVGIEHTDDLIEDISSALQSVSQI